MSTTKRSFSRGWLTSYPDMIWWALEQMREQVASEYRIIGWPEFGSTYIEQNSTSGPIEYIGERTTRVTGPVRIGTRGRFFDIYDPVYNESVRCWGLINPANTQSSQYPWASVDIRPTGKDDEFVVGSCLHRTATELSKVAQVHPLEMIAKLYGLSCEVRDRCAKDLEQAEVLRGALGADIDLLMETVEVCALGGSKVDVSGLREVFLREFDPQWLTRNPFGLSGEVAKAVAAVQAGVD